MNSVPPPPKSIARTLPFQLGRYSLFDKIGTGGMADIYLARSATELGATRLVVIKEVKPRLTAIPRFAELLIAEAKLAAQMSHSNIVAVEDLSREHGVLFIALEYVEGIDLRELLRQCTKRKIPLPLRFSMLIMCEVLRALDYAHRFETDGGVIGIVHRDVSPSNVLLSFDGEVKLCDFGIASAVTADAEASDTIEGKAGYMSPEHARGAEVDTRSDIFAAGILTWELLSGRRMYKSVDEPLIEVAKRCEVPPLQCGELPEKQMLNDAVMRALAVDPAHRYDRARDMLDALENYCLASRLLTTPIRLGSWLSEHFADEKVERRRSRERAIEALELLGAPLVIQRLPSSIPPSVPGVSRESSWPPPPSKPPSEIMDSPGDWSVPGSEPPRTLRSSAPPPESMVRKRELASEPDAAASPMNTVWVALAVAAVVLVALLALGVI